MSLSSFPKRLVLYQFIVCLSLLVLSGAFSLLPAQSDPFCCQNISLTITPSAADPCCLIISYTPGAPSCTSVYGVEVEDRNFGVWVPRSTSGFTRNGATGAFSFQVCVTPGHHVLRIHFKDAYDTLLCTKDIAYSCATVDCCDNVSLYGNELQNATNPDLCCFTILGHVPQDCFAVETWSIDNLINGQWTTVASATTDTVSNLSFAFSQCFPRTDGPFTSRVVFRDFLGNVVCSKDFSYDCNGSNCCQEFNFQIIPGASSDPGRCCFTLQGTKTRACNFNVEYTIEEFVNGQWQNIMGGSYQPFGGPFTLDVCRPEGTHRFRAILRSGPAGSEQIICVKEASYNCTTECCSTISATLASITPGSNCCSLSVDLDLGSCYAFLTCQVEYLVAGQWTSANSFVALQQIIPYTDCIPFGTTKVRFVFSDNNGVLCTREIDVACSNPCCDQLGATLSPQLPVAGQCCFDIWLDIPSCLPSGTFTISEMDWRGGWHVTRPSAPYTAPTFYWVANHCITYDASPGRFRFDFYDANGVLLCSHELPFTCGYGAGQPGKLGVPAPSGEQQTGIVRDVSYAPNPATDETVLSYALSTEAPVQIELVNALGQRELVQKATQQLQGLHTLPIKTSHLSAGMYTLLIKAGNQQISTNLVVVK